MCYDYEVILMLLVVSLLIEKQPAFQETLSNICSKGVDCHILAHPLFVLDINLGNCLVRRGFVS